MKQIIEEFTYEHPDHGRRFVFRIGSTFASALAGFLIGALGTILYFYIVFSKLLPVYCNLQ